MGQIVGDYHELPRYYGRWAPNFWKKKGKKDNHAIYLDRTFNAGHFLQSQDRIHRLGLGDDVVGIVQYDPATDRDVGGGHARSAGHLG